jgi:phosphohistidine phosphatase
VSELLKRQLLLMRHAKSSWDNANMTDHDRPLAPRGRRAAPEMAEWLVKNGYVPEVIRCSTACRARETADFVLNHLPKKIPIDVLGVLYHAPPETLKGVAAQVAPEVSRVLLVAHNPGMYELLNEFTSHDTPFPTAAIACLEAESSTWGDFFSREPQLKFLITPKEIDY